MTARDTMDKLFAEARELQARNHTTEEEHDLRAKAPAIIEAACREQHNIDGSVFPPSYCLVCDGCPLGALVKGIARAK